MALHSIFAGILSAHFPGVSIVESPTADREGGREPCVSLPAGGPSPDHRTTEEVCDDVLKLAQKVRSK